MVNFFIVFQRKLDATETQAFAPSVKLSSILHPKRRAIFRPGFTPIIESGCRHIGMSQPPWWTKRQQLSPKHCISLWGDFNCTASARNTQLSHLCLHLSLGMKTNMMTLHHERLHSLPTPALNNLHLGFLVSTGLGQSPAIMATDCNKFSRLLSKLRQGWTYEESYPYTEAGLKLVLRKVLKLIYS